MPLQVIILTQSIDTLAGIEYLYQYVLVTKYQVPKVVKGIEVFKSIKAIQLSKVFKSHVSLSCDCIYLHNKRTVNICNWICYVFYVMDFFYYIYLEDLCCKLNKITFLNLKAVFLKTSARWMVHHWTCAFIYRRIRIYVFNISLLTPLSNKWILPFFNVFQLYNQRNKDVHFIKTLRNISFNIRFTNRKF